MNILLTICARSGSKGVKNKNIRNVAGKPLMEYTIEKAKKWGEADKIICSTDSEEIAEIARNKGIEAPFIRPAELAGDEIGKLEVVRHALNKAEEIYGKIFDIVVDLDISSPLRKTRDIGGCFKVFEEKNADVVFSVVEAHRNPYFNMVELKKNGFAKVCKKGKEFVRRQDTPKVYDANASIYFYKREFLLNPKNSTVLATDKAAVYVMDEISGHDIDSETDLKYVEFLIKEGVLNE